MGRTPNKKVFFFFSEFDHFSPEPYPTFFFIFYGGLHKVSHDYVEVFAVHYFGTPTFGKDSLRIKNWEWEYENNEFGVSFDT